jgi:hypothetical protein
MNVSNRTEDAGQRCSSGILRASQNTWKTSSPEPYDSRVLGACEWAITVRMRWRSASETGTRQPRWSKRERAVAGSHNRNLSLARQWGRKEDGMGVKVEWYVRGVALDEAVIEGRSGGDFVKVL